MLFVSTMAYVMGKLLGMREAADRFNLEVQNPTRECMPAVRAFWRLRKIDTMVAYVDTAATYIGKGRSRAMAAFLECADADVWVSVDDDVEATLPTLRFMVEACRRSRGICHVPTLKRQPSGLPAMSDTWVRSVTGLIVRPIDNVLIVGGMGGAESAELDRRGAVVAFDHAGFGLTAIHRDALQMFVPNWDDDDGKSKAAVFFPIFENRHWYEEDFAFYKRLPSNVARECLVTGDSFHDGQHLDLSGFESYLLETDPDSPLTPRNV
jgi:hypothetical protein